MEGWGRSRACGPLDILTWGSGTHTHKYTHHSFWRGPDQAHPLRQFSTPGLRRISISQDPKKNCEWIVSVGTLPIHLTSQIKAPFFPPSGSICSQCFREAHRPLSPLCPPPWPHPLRHPCFFQCPWIPRCWTPPYSEIPPCPQRGLLRRRPCLMACWVTTYFEELWGGKLNWLLYLNPSLRFEIWFLV